jgi:hypothetical protein
MTWTQERREAGIIGLPLPLLAHHPALMVLPSTLI